VPKHAHDQVKKDFWAIWNGIEEDAGEAAVLEAEKRVKAFSAEWKKLYPAAVSCLEDDLGHLTTYLCSRRNTRRASGTQTSSRERSARPVGV